ncbi:MAG: NAD-dependent epimerase/dehydratase family protein [Gammaproteobacteria bacterium]|jgi:nucleoside-diphosphate-sugar epimerase
MDVAIAGAGYTGSRLACASRQRGADVLAMTRAPERHHDLKTRGVRSLPLDLDAAGAAQVIQTAGIGGRAIFYMVPPPDDGQDDPRIGSFLAALSSVTPSPSCLVYLSTSAVYGDCGGRLVDESAPPRPASDRGRRRLDAERQVLAWGASRDIPVRVLRVPGIYGPGRLPLERLAAGAAVASEEPVPRPGNRIHVDDLVGACLAASVYRGPHQVFNVGDGNHASMGEYFRRVAALADLPQPEQVDFETLLARASPMMRSFLQESRRLDTRLMRSELAYLPRYQDLDEGIRASLAESAAAG